MKNRQFKLAQRPQGMVKASDFEFVESAVGEPQDGEVLTRILYISLDPAMRGWMNEGKSYIPPVGLGEVMRAGTLGQIVASKNPGYKAGDYVVGTDGVQDYAISNTKGYAKVDAKLAPLPKYLGVLGMPGLTAYFGLLEVGQPKAGETIVVSGAAGAVGQVVGQIGKILGCRVIGIAGGADKCEFVVKELGFDACIDYKHDDVKKALKKAAPEGIDVYFDNVGGDILDAVLTQLRMKARVVICGAISQYNNMTAVKGPSNYMSLLVNRARMEGMVVFDWAKRYGEGIAQMAQWMAQGKLKSREHVVEGLKTFPETLQMLFTGENTGKLVLKVDHAN
ncbi:MAG TPA: NADP-dependent oxidoreductase [Nevskiaceae bacterium]|nr:NADP-dependent oxidoreductase [Nevskiaceae bacterium]